MKFLLSILVGAILGWVIMNVYQNIEEPYVTPVIYESYKPDISDIEQDFCIDTPRGCL